MQVINEYNPISFINGSNILHISMLYKALFINNICGNSDKVICSGSDSRVWGSH